MGESTLEQVSRRTPVRWMPGAPDLVFVVALASVLVGGRHRLLNDPGTFWHVQLGRDIARTGAVPRCDTLTFTHDHAPWVDQSWLFDLGLAWVVERGGWSSAALASALVLATLYAAVARGLLHDGRSPLVALVVALLATGIGATHFLVRPHLMTLVLVWVMLRVCHLQHERGGWWIAWAPPITALWANLHGGFLAGPLVVFTATAGHAISGRWDAARRREIATFAVAGVLCLVAVLVNPYGFGLYRHVTGLLLSSGVTELIEEYQPIPFGKGDARVVEWVILGLIALPTFVTARMSRYELAHALVWLHLGLASVRHAPLFGLAVAPGLARLLDGVLSARGPAPEDASRTLWPVVLAAILGFGALVGVPYGRLDPSHWPLAALPALERAPAGSRLFHEQDWGGLIESECRPRRQTFIDDRFELFGRQEVFRYLNVLAGGPDWDDLQARAPIALVWVRPDRALARRLEADPAWRVLHRDQVSVLFERVPDPSQRSDDPLVPHHPRQGDDRRPVTRRRSSRDPSRLTSAR
jgi:hypothetical protein